MYIATIPISVVYRGVIYHPGEIRIEDEEIIEKIVTAAGLGLDAITEEESERDEEQAGPTREEILRKLPVAKLREMAREHNISASLPKQELTRLLAEAGA